MESYPTNAPTRNRFCRNHYTLGLGASAPCARCGERVPDGLVVLEDRAPLCQWCGYVHAPDLSENIRAMEQDAAPVPLDLEVVP